MALWPEGAIIHPDDMIEFLQPFFRDVEKILKMNKVYLVEQEFHDEDGNVTFTESKGIFSTKEKAVSYSKTLPKEYHTYSEEELDIWITELEIDNEKFSKSTCLSENVLYESPERQDKIHEKGEA